MTKRTESLLKEIRAFAKAAGLEIDETEGGNHTKWWSEDGAPLSPGIREFRVGGQGNSQAARDDRGTEGG
ncbi:hypothetical protein H351_32205 (plasmid) [Rhodococcus erythropolis R138]|nr:hypothetical protein H351_32205 [Rhodococcus erythropolis R138]